MSRNATDSQMMSYLYDELSPTERTAFEQRMVSDAALRSEVDALQATRGLVQQAYEPVEPPVPLMYDLLREARAAVSVPEKQSWFERVAGYLMQPAVATALLVCVVLGTSVVVFQRDQHASMDTTPNAPFNGESTPSAQAEPALLEAERRDAPPPPPAEVAVADLDDFAAREELGETEEVAASADETVALAEPSVSRDGVLEAGEPGATGFGARDERETDEVGALGGEPVVAQAVLASKQVKSAALSQAIDQVPQPTPAEVAVLDTALRGTGGAAGANSASGGVVVGQGRSGRARGVERRRSKERRPSTTGRRARGLRSSGSARPSSESRAQLAKRAPLGDTRAAPQRREAEPQVAVAERQGLNVMDREDADAADGGLSNVEGRGSSVQPAQAPLSVAESAPSPASPPAGQVVVPSPTTAEDPADSARTVAANAPAATALRPPARSEDTAPSQEEVRAEPPRGGGAASTAAVREYDQAMRHYRERRYAQAVRELEGYLQTHRSDGRAPSAQHNLARSYDRSNRLRQAIQQYQDLLRRYPSYGHRRSVLVEIAQLELRSGNLDAARRHLRSAVSDGPGSDRAQALLEEVEGRIVSRNRERARQAAERERPATDEVADEASEEAADTEKAQVPAEAEPAVPSSGTERAESL